MLVGRYGQEQFLRFYRATAALRGLPADRAVQQVLGLSPRHDDRAGDRRLAGAAARELG